jgi:cytochrome c nitrite reductase small subunit
MIEENIIKGMGIALCLFTILLLTYTLLSRGKAIILDVTAHWLLLFIFVILTPMAYWVSFAVGIEGSKSVNFCNSCHVMETRVEDLQDPESEHLAAMHYKYRWISDNQCYHCHSDYGLFGTLRAKQAGLRHVWSYYVVGYEFPLKIRGTYNNRICLFCHGPVLDYQELEEHVEHLKDLELNKKSCLGSDCHNSPHPQERLENGIRREKS